MTAGAKAAAWFACLFKATPSKDRWKLGVTYVVGFIAAVLVVKMAFESFMANGYRMSVKTETGGFELAPARPQHR